MRDYAKFYKNNFTAPKSEMDKFIDVSIVIELDNTCFHHNELSEKFSLQLLSLNKQILESKYRFEILVCYSIETVNNALLTNTKKFSEKKFASSQLKFLGFYNACYYQLKNNGAESAQGNLIIFFDSDVTCEIDWLEKLIRPFKENNNIKVVAGRTELVTETTIQQGQLLVTFFDNCKKIKSLHVTKNFFANNVAFEKELFLKYKFPIVQKTARTSCAQLAENLFLDNINIYKQNQAIVYHRSVSKISELLLRSITEGRDITMHKVKKYKSPFKRAKIPIKLFSEKFNLLTCRVSWIKRHGHTAGIPIASCVIAFVYIIIMSISASLTLLLPKYMCSRFFKI